jgi:small subunit ribosomal protein S12e
MADLDSDTLRAALKAATCERKIHRGLNEVARALDQRQAVACFLAEDLKEDNYKKLIEALARDANVPLVKVDNAKTLGEWVGLCKIDDEGEVTKVVACGSVVIKEWPVMGGEACEKFKAALSAM